MVPTYKAFLRRALVAVMMLSPSLVCAQAPAATAAKLDVSYVTPDSVFAAVVHPSRILNTPIMQMNPMAGQGLAQAKKSLGFDPAEIEQVILILELPESGAEPNVGIVLRLTKSHELNTILPSVREKTTEAALGDKTYLRSSSSKDPCMFMPDDRTLLLATDAMLHKMVANREKPVAGALSGLLARFDDCNDLLAVLRVEPLRPMAAAMPKDPRMPPQIADVVKIPQLVDTFGVKVNLTGVGGFTLSARCADEASATEVERILNACLDYAKQSTSAESAAMIAGDPESPAAAMHRQMQSAVLRIIEMLRPTRKGTRLEVAREGVADFEALGEDMVALLPAIMAARQAARRAAEAHNGQADPPAPGVGPETPPSLP